jgi:hypothetical protein
MIIYLDKHKVKPIDREKFLSKYSSNRGYNMLVGTPLIISVDGTYVDINDLISAVHKSEYKSIVANWITGVKSLGLTKDIEFKWYRG